MIVQVAVFSPAVAVMVAVPSPMAVTIPSGDTVATASSEDVHVLSCPFWKDCSGELYGFSLAG